MSFLRVEGIDKRSNHRDDIEEEKGEIPTHRAGFEVRISVLSQGRQVTQWTAGPHASDNKRMGLWCYNTIPANTSMSRETGPPRTSERSPEF